MNDGRIAGVGGGTSRRRHVTSTKAYVLSSPDPDNLPPPRATKSPRQMN